MEGRLRLGIQRIEDPNHPGGYREVRSLAEMRRLLKPKDRRAKRQMRYLLQGVHRIQ